MKWTHARWLLAGLLAFASASHAADVMITVNGKVVAKPCTVSTTNTTVDLGDLYTFNFGVRRIVLGLAQPGAQPEQLPDRYITGYR